MKEDDTPSMQHAEHACAVVDGPGSANSPPYRPTLCSGVMPVRGQAASSSSLLLPSPPSDSAPDSKALREASQPGRQHSHLRRLPACHGAWLEVPALT